MKIKTNTSPTFNYFARVKPATATRKNSAHVTRDFAVTHSAVHRSTEFFAREATVTVFPKNGNPYQRKDQYSRNVFEALQFWKIQGDEAIDAFVGGLFLNLEIVDCHLLALARVFPAWTFRAIAGTGKNSSQVAYEASRASGKLQELIGACSVSALIDKL